LAAREREISLSGYCAVIFCGMHDLVVFLTLQKRLSASGVEERTLVSRGRRGGVVEFGRSVWRSNYAAVITGGTDGACSDTGSFNDAGASLARPHRRRQALDHDTRARSRRRRRH